MKSSNEYLLIAKKYANALIGIAEQMGFDRITKDLNTILQIHESSPELVDVMINPVVSDSEKFSIIDRVFSQEVENTTCNFLKILVEKNRYDALEYIIEAYNAELDSINNVKRVRVISAVGLNDIDKQRIKSKLEEKLNKTAFIDWSVESDIIAGLVVKIDDDVIDNSIKHKFEDLSKNIMKWG